MHVKDRVFKNMIQRIGIEETAIALLRLDKELSNVIDDPSDKSSVAVIYKEKIYQLQNARSADERRTLIVELTRLLATQEGAIAEFENQLEQIRIYQPWLQKKLAILASKLQVSNDELDRTIEVLLLFSPSSRDDRKIILQKGGTSSTTSSKLSNFSLSFRNLFELVAGGIMTGADIVGNPHPFIFAAGIGLIVLSLMDSIKIDISEREASVLWGIFKGQGNRKCIPEINLVKHTNNERQALGLSEYQRGEITLALKALERKKVVELIDGEWC